MRSPSRLFLSTGSSPAPSKAPSPASRRTPRALGLSEEATEELRTKTEELGSTLGDFVDPLGAYTGLLAEKQAAEEQAARDTAAATESTADSWEDYATDVGVSFDEYMGRLEEQLSAQENWQVNMLRLAGSLSQGTIDELARMGAEGAPLVADLVNRSDAELDRFDDITAARSKEATDAWGQQLTLAQPVLAAIGRTAGASRGATNTLPRLCCYLGRVASRASTVCCGLRWLPPWPAEAQRHRLAPVRRCTARRTSPRSALGPPTPPSSARRTRRACRPR
jgi:hypothetical protein